MSRWKEERNAEVNFLSMREGMMAHKWRDWPLLETQIFHTNEQQGRQQNICAVVGRGSRNLGEIFF